MVNISIYIFVLVEQLKGGPFDLLGGEWRVGDMA